MPTALSTTAIKKSESLAKPCVDPPQFTGNPQLLHVNISPEHTLGVGLPHLRHTKSRGSFSCPLMLASLKGNSAAMSHLDHTRLPIFQSDVPAPGLGFCALS